MNKVEEQKFSDFGLDENILEAIGYMGFKKPTPIQEQAIPVIMQKKDLIACAQTGTGKTGAFLLPVLHELVRNPSEKVQVLIIVPTRELAVQIDQQLEGFTYTLPVSTIPVYGGSGGNSFEQEKQAFISGANIIVATPGRLIMHMNQQYVDFSQLKHLILDEADRMLDMGFHDDIMRIISKIPKNRQTLLFSATMPPKIRTLAAKILKNQPEEISISISKPAEGIAQEAYMVYESQKPALIQNVFNERNLPSVIVFASTKLKVKVILKEIKALGFNARAVSSDLEQHEREEVLNAFRNKQLPILVATDVLSRGIDIEGISLVLNYDVPQDPEDYIHRVGRTARAASKGVAITFITPEDQHRFVRIEKLIGREIEKTVVPAELGETPPYSPSQPKANRKKSFSQGKRKFSPGQRQNNKPRN